MSLQVPLVLVKEDYHFLQHLEVFHLIFQNNFFRVYSRMKVTLHREKINRILIIKFFFNLHIFTPLGLCLKYTLVAMTSALLLLRKNK